jgi:hypothetical protein
MRINVTQLYPMGSHFTCWSLSWLSGQSHYLNRQHEWKVLDINPKKKHTLHGHRIPIGRLDEVNKLPKDTKSTDRLVTMIVAPPDELNLDQLEYQIRWERQLEQLRGAGWHSVICHDFDVDSEVSELWVRHHEHLDVTQTSDRNQAVINELTRLYPKIRVPEELWDKSLVEAHRQARRKPFVDSMVRTFEKRGLLRVINTGDLLSGDTTGLARIMEGWGVAIQDSRLETWHRTQEAWSRKNRPLMTWRSQVAGWAEAIVNRQDLDIPEWDHYQIAVVQRHLMTHHNTRLRDGSRFTTARDYHGNLYVR